MRELYFVTGNNYKFSEAKRFMNKVFPDIEFKQLEIKIPELQSTDSRKVLHDKVEYVRSRTNKPFIVDDVTVYTTRFKGFPGTYTSFINETLGMEGWRRLFEDGDGISITCRLVVSYLDECHEFSGSVMGKIRFDKSQSHDAKNLINNIFYIDSLGKTLGDAMEQGTFKNHRLKALDNLTKWIKNERTESEATIAETAKRWDSRAETWEEFITQQTSYVNFEDCYRRFNVMLEKVLPLVQKSVFEIGCGTGNVSRTVTSKRSDLTLDAIDISGGMVETAVGLTKDENIRYKQSTIFEERERGNTYGMVFTRGVLLSHMPKFEVFDFLAAAARMTNDNGYVLFDFMQDVNKGEVERPVGHKNEFSIHQLDMIMAELGLERVADDGDDSSRVRIACYQKILKCHE